MTGLEILDDMTNEELEVLVRLIIDEGGITESLTDYSDYVKFSPDHHKYTYAIRKEIIEYGSNTFWDNKSYKEIVCDKLDVNYNSGRSLEHIEHNLLEVVLEKTWEEMSETQKQEVLNSISKGNKMLPQATSAALIGLFRAGGFASYQLAVVVANSIANFVVGRGLSLAANAALTRALSIFAGPVGMALTALWTFFSISGPAYRVTIPATVYIASIREIYSKKDLAQAYF